MTERGVCPQHHFVLVTPQNPLDEYLPVKVPPEHHLPLPDKECAPLATFLNSVTDELFSRLQELEDSVVARGGDLRDDFTHFKTNFTSDVNATWVTCLQIASKLQLQLIHFGNLEVEQFAQLVLLSSSLSKIQSVFETSNVLTLPVKLSVVAADSAIKLTSTASQFAKVLSKAGVKDTKFVVNFGKDFATSVYEYTKTLVKDVRQCF